MTWLSDRAVGRLQRLALWPDLDGLRYTVVAEIGRGGMGTVYRARDEILGRDVALKVINAIGPHHALAARLEQEAHVLARLEHPGIVPVHDAGTLADGRAYYVMKLVRGASLPAHLATVARLDERLRIFSRICEPVAFAHAHGVVHRDLKPANVMVGSFGEVLVLDWGLATAARSGTPPCGDAAAPDGVTPVLPRPDARSLTEAGTIVGTPGYMAPEQARGDDSVDARADVYALGAMLATMLTDDVSAPPSGALAPALKRRRLPPRLRAICLKAVAESPEQRYPEAAALADDVARFLGGMPVSAHREGWLERGWRLAVTHRTPILLVLGYLIMRTLVAIYVSR